MHTLRQNIARFRTLIVIEAACGMDEQSFHIRGESIGRDTRRLRRFAKYALHTIIGSTPDLYNELFRQQFAARNMDLIGQGFHADVIRVENNVYKFYRASANMTDEERTGTLEKYRQEYEKLKICMGGYPVDTAFFDMPNPFRSGDSRIIVAQQPYIETVTPVKLMTSDWMVGLRKSQMIQVADFAEKCLAMIHSDCIDAIPDITGHNNVGFTADGRLRLVDTGLLPRSLMNPHLIEQLNSITNHVFAAA